MTRAAMPLRSTAFAALTLLTAVACADRQVEPLATDTADVQAPATHVHAAAKPAFAADPEVAKWLAGLRQATAAFHQISAAEAAGWDVQATGCMELPGTGGMGEHYLNPGLMDAVPEAFAPELLVYEPQKNGTLRLVAVEFAVPFTEWSQPDPPSIRGVPFHRNETFGLWVLHAWIWKNNPAGMFEDWNPVVSCEHVP